MQILSCQNSKCPNITVPQLLWTKPLCENTPLGLGVGGEVCSYRKLITTRDSLQSSWLGAALVRGNEPSLGSTWTSRTQGADLTQRGGWVDGKLKNASTKPMHSCFQTFPGVVRGSGGFPAVGVSTVTGSDELSSVGSITVTLCSGNKPWWSQGPQRKPRARTTCTNI